MINEAARRLGDVWFAPKRFESPQLYERLGIRTFKKWMPFSGDMVVRHVWKTGRKVTLSVESVERMKKGTEFPEKLHLAGAFALPIAGVLVGQIGWANAANILVNIYPIMLQRYNRIRYQEVLKRMQSRMAVTT